MALTTKAVEAAKPRDQAYKLTDGNGLYLYVSTTGTRSWRANYTAGGKQKTRTYGQYPSMPLAAAREANRVAKGATAAPAAKACPTFKEAAQDWLSKKIPELSNGKHQLQVANTLERFAYPLIGSTPLDQLTRTQLVAVVKSVGDRIETAHRVAGRITSVLNYALDTGVIEHHSGTGLTRVLVSKRKLKPMNSIPYREAGRLLRDIDTYNDPVTKLALQLMAHTFVRVRELTGMRWSELREDGAVWVVPEERMKLRLPHVVPLAPQARAILDKLRLFNGDCELVMESAVRPGHPLSENTLLFALYRLGYRGRMTAHGFRSLASTVLNEQSGFPNDVIERQLAHKETDAVRAAYNRAQYLDQRRELMAWWANWLETQWRDAGPTPANGWPHGRELCRAKKRPRRIQRGRSCSLP